MPLQNKTRVPLPRIGEGPHKKFKQSVLNLLVVRNGSILNTVEAHTSMVEAYLRALDSEDPRTQVGCVAVDSRGNIVGGYNQPHRGLSTEQWDNTVVKHKAIIHAETQLIGNMARSNTIEGAFSVFGTVVCCVECAKSLVAAGPRLVVGHLPVYAWLPEHWHHQVLDGLTYLAEAGVHLAMVTADDIGVLRVDADTRQEKDRIRIDGKEIQLPC